MKYIIIDLHGAEVPILFHDDLTHDRVAAGYEGLVVSAGFCTRKHGGGWFTHGVSTSLHMLPRKGVDDAIISEVFPS